MKIHRRYPQKKTISMIVALPFPGHLKAEEGENDHKQHGEEQSQMDR